MIQCSAPKKKDALLEEAAKIHNEAVELAKQLEDELSQLARDTTYMRDSLESWRVAIEKWENNLVEVPGNESHDHKSHDHHYHGKQQSELTSDQILSIQNELKAQIDSIKSRINAKH
jgi:hypothetical protein